jgi:hypothetical protein
MSDDDTPQDTDDASLDLDNRVLCADGNCIGVIGSDGRCKECGKAAGEALTVAEQDPDEPPEPAAPAEPTDDAAAAAEPPAAEDAEPVAPAAPSAGNSWDDRVLCSDGNCIGVIGADGRCKECGKPFAGDAQ